MSIPVTVQFDFISNFSSTPVQHPTLRTLFLFNEGFIQLKSHLYPAPTSAIASTLFLKTIFLVPMGFLLKASRIPHSLLQERCYSTSTIASAHKECPIALRSL